MDNLRKGLKEAIIKEYGSVQKWVRELDVTPERFYNFLKGEYDPKISTVEKWLKSVNLDISLKKNKKS